ncbi:DEKNAAC100726 [Brettanomyces naardenensis]|uniref:DEKNAAC100726 n=1 Tax=Brettanomyces naardenensis TaxID=13370 RepID=A0A448YG93_BRENA|nr:DEKNAAC100726 [Brettanomyces naardenensis]
MITLFPATAALPEFIDKSAEYNGKHLLSALGTPSGKRDTTRSLVKLLLALSDAGLQNKIVSELSISQLVAFLVALLGITNNPDGGLNTFKGSNGSFVSRDSNESVGFNGFRDYHTLEAGRNILYRTIIHLFNTFPCVKLVDELVPRTGDPFSEGLQRQDSNDRFKPKSESKTESDADLSLVDDHFDDEDDELPDAESCKYQLSVHSEEYRWLLAYLMDGDHETIVFPLVEIKTRHLNKVGDFLKYFVRGVKISNQRLTMLGSSNTILEKLKVITVSSYENFSTIRSCSTCEKLIVYGNEVDMEGVRALVTANPGLKRIYYKGRVARKGETFAWLPNGRNAFDLILLEGIDYALFKKYGPENFLSLSVHLLGSTVDNDDKEKSSLDIDYLLHELMSLRKFQLNCLFDDHYIDVSIHLGIDHKNTSLRHLTLTRCHFDNSSEFSGLKNLESLRMIGCSLRASVLNTLKDCKCLRKLSLVNCDILWDHVLELPCNLQNLTLQNSKVESCMDLLFLSYSTNATEFKAGADMDRLVRLDLNSERLYFRLESSDRLAVYKPNGSMAKDISPKLIHFPSGMNHLSVTNYPNFESVDLSSVSTEEFALLDSVDVNVYAYGNLWKRPIQLPRQDTIKYKMKYINVNRIGKEPPNMKTAADELDDAADEDAASDTSMSYASDAEASFSESASRKRAGRSRKGRGKGGKRGYYGRLADGSSPIPLPTDAPVATIDGKYVDSNREDLSAFEEGYQGRRLPFPVAKHTAPPLATPDDPTKPYQCRFCKRSFDRRENFRRHSLIHTDYRPYVCPKCKKGFKRSDNLRSHMRVCHADNFGEEGSSEGQTKRKEEDESSQSHKKLKMKRAYGSNFRFEPTELASATMTPNPDLSRIVSLATPPPTMGSNPLSSKIKMFEFVPGVKTTGTGMLKLSKRDLFKSDESASSPLPQLLQTAPRKSQEHPNNVLVFRMEKPQETLARQQREAEKKARLKEQIEDADPQQPGPSSEQMERRRYFIRGKVNEAFEKCSKTEDGHYICFKCGKNFAKRGNVKRHLILHLDVDLYDCICGRTFQRSDNYKTHFAKCKRRKELGLPVTFDADDMQVVPRRKVDRMFPGHPGSIYDDYSSSEGNTREGSATSVGTAAAAVTYAENIGVFSTSGQTTESSSPVMAPVTENGPSPPNISLNYNSVNQLTPEASSQLTMPESSDRAGFSTFSATEVGAPATVSAFPLPPAQFQATQVLTTQFPASQYPAARVSAFQVNGLPGPLPGPPPPGPPADPNMRNTE